MSEFSYIFFYIEHHASLEIRRLMIINIINKKYFLLWQRCNNLVQKTLSICEDIDDFIKWLGPHSLVPFACRSGRLSNVKNTYPDD